MRLTAWEEERLLIYTAAELARRHRDAGLPLNHPEAVALICDAMLEAARAGADYATVEAAGRDAVSPDEVMPGIAGLIDEVRLEVLFGDGPRLIVLAQPLGPAPSPPGEIVAGGERPTPPARERIELLVTSESRRIIRVSSHYPFERVNTRLAFDREAATGFRLDLPAGATERWDPGEQKRVTLVRRSTGR